MVENEFNHPLTDSLFSVFFIDIDIKDIGKARFIRDSPRVTDLIAFWCERAND
jgi:hypothetical protein